MALKTLFFLVFFNCLLLLKAQSQNLHLSSVGHSEHETSVIDSLYHQKNFKDYLSLQTEAFSVKERLVKQGYIDCELTQLKKSNDSTYLAKYKLNQLYKSVTIHIDKSIDPAALKSIGQIHNGSIEIDVRSLEETLELLNQRLSDKGDPFLSLQLVNIEKSGHGSLTADLVVSEPLPKRVVDSVIVKGYEKFPKSYIKRYLKLKPKQEFNLNTIKTKTSEIDNLPFASQTKEPEVLFTKDSTLIYIYVEKKQSNSFDGFLGFGTNEETSKIEFNGYLNLNLTNNLNFGESFRLQYKSDESEQKTFDVETVLPYLFSSPVGLELGLNIFKKDSSFVTVSQLAKVNYQINPKNKVSLGVNAINSTNLLDTDFLGVYDYNTTFFIVDYHHIKRNSYRALFPVEFQINLSAGMGSRTYEGAKENQTRFLLVTEKIFDLNDKNSIYLKLSGALLFSDNYFENELFRFGGINSIRGFQENSLAANLFSVLNTEYRYQLSSSLYVHTVLDTGYLENNIVLAKEKLFGFGFGFGLLTNAGLLKFNYSLGKVEQQVLRLSDSKIHLSLTANF